MSDLWDDLGDPDEVLSDEAGGAILDDDSDDMACYLPNSKRQKLNRKFNTGGKRKRRGDNTNEKDDEQAVELLSDDDSDQRILQEKRQARRQNNKQATPQSGPSKNKPKPTEAKLDNQSKALLNSVNLNLALLQKIGDEQEIEIEDDSDDDDGSPVRLQNNKAAGGSGQKRQNPSGRNKATQSDDDDDQYISEDVSRDEKADDRITIIVKASDKEHAQFRLKRTDKLGKVMEAFRAKAVHEKWMPANGTIKKFVFDGEKVNENTTPEDLDMDDGETLDCFLS